MIKFIDLEQGTQEWLDFRKGKIGSSMAASIVGVGFKTPLQLFEDLMEEKVTVVNEAMMRGTRLEPEARQWLNDKCKADLQPVVIQHPISAYDWHISSLDGLWVRPDGSVFVCEIKCPGAADHAIALDGRVPEKYLPQLWHILEDLPEVDKILYFSYHPDSQAEVWVHRNEVEIAEQFYAETEFYQRLLNFRPPEPTDKDWIDNYDPALMEYADKYSAIMDQMKALQVDADECKARIIAAMGTSTRAKIGSLKVQKVDRDGSIDYTLIEALKGLDLTPYRKEKIVSWRLTR